MDQPIKKQKVVETTSCKESVLFNSDTLSKIISYLPSVDVLNLALTCKRFGVSNTKGEELSLIEESAQQAVQDIATEEELETLPYYNGENSLANYHYLQFMRGPLTFDQLIGGAEYENGENKSCVIHCTQANNYNGWETAISNNILRTGKHYASFKLSCTSTKYSIGSFIGIMRPGQVNQNIRIRSNPFWKPFYQNFTERLDNGEYDNENSVKCCVFSSHTGNCISSTWPANGLRSQIVDEWEGMEAASLGDEIGMLLDLDDNTLTAYKNGRKLGEMKRGVSGPYCWMASLYRGNRVSIQRGTIPS